MSSTPTVRKTAARAKTVAPAKSKRPASAPGLVIGTLTGFDQGASPLVAWDGQPACPARTLVHLQAHHVGESVALQFERSDMALPLILGVVQARASADLGEGRDDSQARLSTAHPIAATLDDEHLTLTAKRSITLQCGRASITLDAKGNVEIRGSYVLSRSSGQNRIKGSSVSLN